MHTGNASAARMGSQLPQRNRAVVRSVPVSPALSASSYEVPGSGEKQTATAAASGGAGFARRGARIHATGNAAWVTACKAGRAARVLTTTRLSKGSEGTGIELTRVIAKIDGTSVNAKIDNESVYAEVSASINTLIERSVHPEVCRARIHGSSIHLSARIRRRPRIDARIH